MRSNRQLGLAVGIALFALTLQSCSLGIFRTAPEYAVSDLLIEEHLNGYLIRIVAHSEIDHFEAWASVSNWLYITIAEVAVNIENLELLKPAGIVERIEITPFETSVQIAMKLSRRIRYCDVIRDTKSYDILVALHLDQGSSKWNETQVH